MDNPYKRIIEQYKVGECDPDLIKGLLFHELAYQKNLKNGLYFQPEDGEPLSQEAKDAFNKHEDKRIEKMLFNIREDKRIEEKLKR